MPGLAHDPDMTDARLLQGAELVAALRDCRKRTLAWTCDLSDAQWTMPQRPGVNPIAWELGHLAWFAEFWVLRGPHRLDDSGHVQARRPAVHAGPDALFDSSVIAHARRWTEPLPSREQLGEMLDAQLQACVADVPMEQDDGDAYFRRLALFHEDMHGEAFAWMRSALGYPPPAGATLKPMPLARAVEIRGGEVKLGRSSQDPGFAFDNELPGYSTTLADFEIDSGPVTAGQFLSFVESGGYENPQYWPDDAGRWRAEVARSQPERWRRRSAGSDMPWAVLWFDRWLPLDPEQPMIHVNAFEAQAYCRWAGRRLPTAAQWEQAAKSAAMADDGYPPSEFLWGHSVWEWTADAFNPYAGFVPGPYKDYSAPWFGSHRELRGGAFATHSRLHDAGYRNFFMPHRSDIFAGFRTVVIAEDAIGAR